MRWQLFLVAALIVALPLAVGFDGNAPTDIRDPKTAMSKIPKTYEETANIVPFRQRYLMYTWDGVHIIWGRYGHGYFVGTDNLGRRAWGIYGKSIFAGFYDGDFFWGKYANGRWKAQGLFGMNYSHGRYVLFPMPVLTAEAVPR